MNLNKKALGIICQALSYYISKAEYGDITIGCQLEDLKAIHLLFVHMYHEATH